MKHPNSKIFFYDDYRHDLIMNFLLNSFQSKSNKFTMESIDSLVQTQAQQVIMRYQNISKIIIKNHSPIISDFIVILTCYFAWKSILKQNNGSR